MWCKTLQSLDTYEVTRCYKPCGFGKVKEFWIHHFSDASEEGYGQVSFIRMVNCDGAVHCNFIMVKARVPPKKYISIPRLELVAATLSVKMAKFLSKELKIGYFQETVWSDSKVVLIYIRSTSKKFKIFVANRIQQIYENSEVNQWRYVPSKNNPADHASRGSIDVNSGGKCSTRVNGPQFLREPEHTSPVQKDVQIVSDTDVEVKYSLKVNMVSYRIDIIDALEKISSWKRIKRIMAVIMKYRETLLNLAKKQKANTDSPIVDMKLLQKGETAVIKQYQRKAFQKEISILENAKAIAISSQSSIYKLDPFLDNYGILRVGGRINKANLDYRLKHLVLLPKEGHITHTIIRDHHGRVAHAGRGMTINEIRNHGYWIINCTGAVKSVISKCVACRKLHRKIC